MGKKKGTSSSGATAGASKASLDWTASTISKREENKMRLLGLISSAESDFRHPGSASRPKPPKGFTVMFVAFLQRGLSLPAHEFLRSLLFFYGIQLWQLTPNSILHLSIFITVCEAFLGIDPHWGLWRKIFYVKRHNGNEGPHVVGGVGFVVRKEVNYFNFLMKESVQGWRQKWFYLRDIPASGRRSNLPLFEDVLAAVPKKSWQNALTAEESKVADQLYEKILDLKNADGQTMCGTEVVTVFLKRRVQPVMSRAHQLWLYTGANDKSRVSSTDFSEEDLRDEVRRLTCLSQKDNIAMTSARPPFDFKHLPSEASTVAQCYPPTPESGIAPKDDDASEETKDDQNIFEDSDALGDEAPKDDALVKSMRRKKINEDLMTTAESSPSGRDDDDADVVASPAPSRETSAPQVTKRPSGLFAEEDDLELIPSEDDDDVPLSKRAKILSDKAESAKESMLSDAGDDRMATPPPRTVVAKVPLSTVNPSASASAPSASRDHPIFATVDAVADFADQFTRLESENVQLRKAVKTSADQVLEANRLAAEAQSENICLKDELKKLKKKMKDEQEARHKAFVEADEKEGALRESIGNLLSTADMPVDRTNKLRVDSMLDALTFETESSKQIQDLLTKTKGALSRLFSMMFPKLDQNKTLGEMADTFFIDSSEAIEVLKRRSRLYGAVLTFQLLMGHGLGSKLEKLSEALPVDANNCLVDLEPFKQSSVLCANRLLKLVEEDKKKSVTRAAPSSSAQTSAQI
ncbi:hypothetical protein ACQ4PT_020475 [Festuca glaucescens]